MHLSTVRPGTRTGSRAGFLLAACVVASTSHADTGLHAVARTTSDYVEHGYSKSDGHPSFQSNVDYSTAAGYYAGGWLSGVDFGGAHLEAIGYAGRRWRYGDDLRLDLSVAGYGYDHHVYGRDADYPEAYGALHFRDVATVGFAVAPDAYGRGRTVYGADLEWRTPLNDVLEASVAGGYTRAARAFDYDDVHWSAGITWFAWANGVLELRYYGAHRMNGQPDSTGGYGELAQAAIDDRLVLSVSLGL